MLNVTNVDVAGFYADGEPSAWYAQAVANLESVSIVPAGGFPPSELARPVTRAEAAQLLSAAMALAEARSESGSAWSRIF